MKSIKAPLTSVSRSAASIPALLLLGVFSGTALAATNIQEPCSEADARDDVLHAFIAEGDKAPLVRTVDATETTASTHVADADDKSAQDAEDADDAGQQTDSSTPAFTTRLPGVSASDMPGFRRHMYRTDI